MIFACTDPACRYMAEGESGEYPVCPKCGGLMLNVPRKAHGEQADLGVFWSRQEEEDTAAGAFTASEGDGGWKCLRHDKSGDLSGKRLGVEDLPQRPGFMSRRRSSVMCRRSTSWAGVSSTVLERTGIRRRPFIVISRRRKWV